MTSDHYTPSNAAKVRMWKHCGPETLFTIKNDIVDLPYGYIALSGPGDKNLSTAIGGLQPLVNPVSSAAGTIDLRFSKKETKLIDAVHTFSVVRLTLNMYRAIIGDEFFSNFLLTLYPHISPTDKLMKDDNGMNAFYDRDTAALYCGYFPLVTGSAAESDDQFCYTCRSLDVVAHETGHAVLNLLQPDWWSSTDAQTNALHESFADLSAIFLTLTQDDQVNIIIGRSKNLLHDRSHILSDHAFQFYEACSTRLDGLRNADNDIKLTDVYENWDECHNLSRVFTGAIYHILCDIYHHILLGPLGDFNPNEDMYRDHDDKECVDALQLAGDILCRLLIKAIKAAPKKDATFFHVAKCMFDLAPQESNCSSNDYLYRYYILGRFMQRKILKYGLENWPQMINIHKRLEKEDKDIARERLTCGCLTENKPCLTMQLRARGETGGRKTASARATGRGPSSSVGKTGKLAVL